MVGIDGLAGPSEVDGRGRTRRPTPCSARVDLVAQAEHDPDAMTHFVTTDPALVPRVEEALAAELATAGRAEIVDAALRHARGDRRARRGAGRRGGRRPRGRAPAGPARPIPALSWPGSATPGAIFLGPWTAVPFGDYGVASNHVLPTAGTARFSSGLRAADYVTVRSVVEMTADAAARLAPRRPRSRGARPSPGTRRRDGRPRGTRRSRAADAVEPPPRRAGRGAVRVAADAGAPSASTRTSARGRCPRVRTAISRRTIAIASAATGTPTAR